ncbi:unnamed protein product [Fraxinus pennsylvanica]|uniref:Uncharacterized protein n=1 Tax=Fraxinus pennsylvanica TaxID=56036 RepID=A0AAD1YXP6_9LAMI|nr:unnamed protein product [Fraxinus pennsylvanica]
MQWHYLWSNVLTNYVLLAVVITRAQFLTPTNIVAPKDLELVARQHFRGSLRIGARIPIATRWTIRQACSLALLVPTTVLSSARDQALKFAVEVWCTSSVVQH